MEPYISSLCCTWNLGPKRTGNNWVKNISRQSTFLAILDASYMDKLNIRFAFSKVERWPHCTLPLPPCRVNLGTRKSSKNCTVVFRWFWTRLYNVKFGLVLATAITQKKSSRKKWKICLRFFDVCFCSPFSSLYNGLNKATKGVHLILHRKRS